MFSTYRGFTEIGNNYCKLFTNYLGNLEVHRYLNNQREL